MANLTVQEIDEIMKAAQLVKFRVWTGYKIAYRVGYAVYCSIGPRGGKYVHILPEDTPGMLWAMKNYPKRLLKKRLVEVSDV